MSARLSILQRELGGEISGRTLLTFSIGHSRRDRGTAYTECPGAPNGILARVHNGNGRADDLAAKSRALEILGELPEYRSRPHVMSDPAEAARIEGLREQHRSAREAEDKAKGENVRRIWGDADPDPRGKLPERFLNEHRKLDLPNSVCGHTIRWHPACPWKGERVPTMLCAYRDIHTDEVVGLHRTRLDPVTAAKIDRMALGRVKSAAIKLAPDAEVTMGLAIAEGVETALSGMALGLLPMWAMGSTGGIAKLPLLNGIEALTVCAEAGEASAQAVQEVGQRWTEGGREVRVCHPRHGSDLNDAIREVSR